MKLIIVFLCDISLTLPCASDKMDKKAMKVKEKIKKAERTVRACEKLSVCVCGWMGVRCVGV